MQLHDLVDVALDADSIIWPTAIALFRIGAIFFVLPAFGEPFVPTRIKLKISLLLSLIASEVIRPNLDIGTIDLQRLVGILVPEVIIGLAFGFLVRLIIYQLQIAGTAIASSISLSALFQSGADSLPPIGIFLKFAGLCLFVSTDLHLYVFWLIFSLYELIPVGVFLELSSFSSIYINAFNYSFNNSFVLASPIIIVFFLFNLTQGFINKAFPQFMVVFISTPFVALYSFYLLTDIAPDIMEVWLLKAFRFIEGGFLVVM